MSDVRKCVVSKAQTRTLVRVKSENAYSQLMLRHTKIAVSKNTQCECPGGTHMSGTEAALMNNVVSTI